MPNLTPDEEKEIMKQAIQEWLDDKVKQFGWWSLKGLAALALVALLSFLVTHGYLFK